MCLVIVIQNRYINYMTIFLIYVKYGVRVYIKIMREKMYIYVVLMYPKKIVRREKIKMTTYFSLKKSYIYYINIKEYKKS
jgi:hypothetical protein